MTDKNRITFNSDAFIGGLRHMVVNGRADLLSTINSGVNLMFWEIGTLIGNKSRSDERHIIEELSNSLAPVFGDYFSNENLSLMRIFAEKCSVATIGKTSTDINWGYIPQFISLKDDSAWMFYFKLMHIHSLTPVELKNEIAANAIENKTIDDEKNISRYDLAEFHHHTSELYFGKKDSANFRKLFEPRDIHDPVLTSFLSKHSNNELVMPIYRLIFEFQSETHYVINFQFNSLLWEIGGELINLSKSLNVPMLDILNKSIQEYEKEFPSLFNIDVLSHCVKFAEQYKTDNQFEITELVSWPYIKILLEVNDIEKQSFIAKEVLNKGIGIQKLKSLIADSFFDIKKEYNVSNMVRSRNSTTTETKNDDTVTSITEELMEPIIHPIHDINRNIYKTQELLTFLTNFE